LKKLLDQEVALNINGSPQRMTVREALVQIVGANGLKGASRDREYLIRLIAQHIPEEFQEETERSLAPDQSAILRRFSTRVSQSDVADAVAAPESDDTAEPADDDWDII
jgi:hypothetical protein